MTVDTRLIPCSSLECKSLPSLHCCWLTEPWKPSREKYLAAWARLDWRPLLWVGPQANCPSGLSHADADEVLRGTPSEKVCRYAILHGDHGTASDLFRWEVLLRHGGAYADVDVTPLIRPEAFAQRERPAFGFDRSGRRMEIRFIWTPGPGHDLIRRIRDEAVRRELAFLDAGGWLQPDARMRDAVKRTGPWMAKEVAALWCVEQGLSLKDLLITAVNERTPENRTEHFFLKEEAAKQLARGFGVQAPNE